MRLKFPFTGRGEEEAPLIRERGDTRVGTLGVAVVLVARGVGEFRLVGLFKRVRGTQFARLDSWVYTPLCLALAAGTVIVASA